MIKNWIFKCKRDTKPKRLDKIIWLDVYCIISSLTTSLTSRIKRKINVYFFCFLFNFCFPVVAGNKDIQTLNQIITTTTNFVHLLWVNTKEKEDSMSFKKCHLSCPLLVKKKLTLVVASTSSGHSIILVFSTMLWCNSRFMRFWKKIWKLCCCWNSRFQND